MAWDVYLTFCLAALALAVVPGPTVTVTVANSLRYGARAGLMNVAGTQVGVLIWLAVAALGLNAAIALMGVWFDVLRWAGAAYLVWLGVKLWRGSGDMGAASTVPDRGNAGFFMQGFVVILSNPKMLVLFSALIPPFLSRNGDVMAETLLLGGTFAVIAAVTDSIWALAAGSAGAWLTRSRIRVVEIVSGTCLIGGGVWMALKGR
jgi:homoserine/homoserine lactone efflux protein